MKKKLVITGATGFLGWHLLKLAVKDWEVYGFAHHNNCTLTGVNAIKCDICNYIELGDYLDDIEPDALIHTAALADANFCQKNPGISRTVNVDASRNIAGICSDFNIPFAFTSTDLVFDGTQGKYKETDAKNPISVYGEHKSEAEEEILKIYPGSVIFRLPFMLGHPDAGTNNYFRGFIDRLDKGETVNLFTDEYRSVCGAGSVARGMLNLFESNSGILHLGGKERLSRYEAGLMMANAVKLPATQIKACRQKDVPLPAPRPADVSMDISKAVALGYDPMLLEDELKLMLEKNYI